MEQTNQKSKVSTKKVIAIVLDVLLYTFLALAIVVVALTVMSKVAQKDDPNGAPNLFGYEMRYVETGSMEPAYPVNTMIFIEKAPTNNEDAKKWFDKVKVGDVLTFYYKIANQQVVITHRVVDIKPNTDTMMVGGQEVAKGGYTIELKGDNTGEDGNVGSQYIHTYAHYNDMAVADDQLNYVIGKVVGQSVVLGNVVTTLKNPLGMVLIIIVPCLIVVIFEVIRIISVINGEKQEKAKKLQEEQSNEIENLRRQLALLQMQNGATDSDAEQIATDNQDSESETQIEQSSTPDESESQGVEQNAGPQEEQLSDKSEE